MWMQYTTALLYAEVNEHRKAVAAPNGVLARRPGEPEVRYPKHSSEPAFEDR